MTSTRQRAEPSAPAGRRFTGLLPAFVLRWRRPIWWQEIAIIAFGYWLYGLGRNAIPKNDRIAFQHARAIQHAQDFLHIDFELDFNHWVAAHEWFAQTCDYYYATLHFIVTPGVLVWMYLRRKSAYRGARTVIVIAGLLGLLCFYVFPTAPPRLLHGYSYIDTVLKFHTWGSLADPHVADHSNQFAAMPSLHIAWAAWAGWTLFRCARHLWVRLLGLIYPLCTLTVILGTANHFLLDGVGGVVLLAIGFAVQYALSGHAAYSPAPGAPSVRGPPVSDPKDDLRTYLQRGRDALLWKLDGLGEYDVRRPMTATGTNLLGLVKHVASCEAGYLGDTFGRPFPEPLPWSADDAPANADMWATADEARAGIVELYRRVWAHSDETIATLPLDATGRVPWWPAEHAQVTLHRVLVHMIAETERHAGHADIVREDIDGAAGIRAGSSNLPEGDTDWWQEHYTRLEIAARTAAGHES